MSRNRVTEKDHGWGRIKGEIQAAQGSGVKVGVLSDSGARTNFPADNARGDSSDADMLLVAAANEFGTDTIPARPFMRGGFDQNQRALGRTAQRLWNQVLAGTLTARQALGLLGEQHQGQVQQYIVALSTPQNADSTIARKGSSNPLNDEGRLRNSIRWEHDE